MWEKTASLLVFPSGQRNRTRQAKRPCHGGDSVRHLRTIARPCRQKAMETTPGRRGCYIVLRIQKLELLS